MFLHTTAYYQWLTRLKKLGMWLHVWHPAVAVAKPNPRVMSLGFNGFFQSHQAYSTPDQLALIQTFKTPVVRSDNNNPVTLEALCQLLTQANATKPVGANNITLLVLIALDTALLNSLIPVITKYPKLVVAVELGNEIDLTDTQPEVFAGFLETGYHTLRNAGYKGDIITGGISSVRPDKLKWLANVMSRFVGVFPFGDIMIGVHRYSINNDANIPQDGYVNRSEELAAVQHVAGGCDIAVTEFGYAILDGESEEIATRNIPLDAKWWQIAGSPYLMWYQWTDGPTNTPIDRYGMRKSSGGNVWTYRTTVNAIKQGA